ncbi:MAG: protein kinase [Melioribacter sp.]|nr:protein kinase [Melioribacter sp.]
MASCKTIEKSESVNLNNEIWFQQENVDLGAKIDMLDENFGFAISKGKGSNVLGKVYFYKQGIWEVVSEHNYSDFPLITVVKPNLIYWIIHGSHHENYKPHLNVYDFKSKKELLLPVVMWDEKDFVMWRGISVLSDGQIFLAGQQGHIIFYKNKKWYTTNNPFKRKENESLNAKDLHDIQMLDEFFGFAVGKNGLILKWNGQIWNKFAEVTNNDLMKISLLDKDFGWVVGKRGTILKYNKNHFEKIPTDLIYNFNSVKTVSKNKAYIVGDKSTLLELKNGKWIQNEAIKIFSDNFVDIDVIEENGKDYIWIIGERGIYTNYHNLKFSFTDVTPALSLRREGRTGIFRDFNNDNNLDLLTLLEDSSPILYKSLNGKSFLEAESYKETDVASSAQAVSCADFDNDGYLDLLEFTNISKAKLLFGSSNFKFRKVDLEDFTKNLTFNDNVNFMHAQVADFNNDGNVDVYVATDNYDYILKNNGFGRFTNVYNETGLKKFSNNNSYSVTLTDFNNDNLIDVVITYKIPVNSKHIFLYLNKGNFRFIEKDDSNFYSKRSPSTYSSLANDFNNDGYTDLVIFNNDSELKLLINDGRANFTDVSYKVGFRDKLFHPEPSGGILSTADVNNDGWLDLFVGSKLFLNSPNFSFKEIEKYVGINFIGNPTFADYDNDGDMDLFLGSSSLALGEGNRAALYRNNSLENNFIKVRLCGDISNRFAIGAKVFLLGYNTKDSLVYVTLRQNGLGGNSLSQENFSEIHFGVNPNLHYKIKVIFPSGIEKIIYPKMNVLNEVYESSFLNRQLILLNKSVFRALNFINPLNELFKFSILLALLVLIFLYSLKTKAIKVIVSKWYFVVIILAFYITLVYFTVTSESFFWKTFPIYFTGVTTFTFVYILSKVIERKESKFISHYKIIDILGVGGTGKVFKAKDVYTSEIFALKIINPILLNEEENRKLLANEGKILTKIDNENVVKVYEFGESERHSYIVMEYLPGGTLDEYIRNNFPIAIEKVINIALQICNGLIAIHKQNIIHRDLKSSNIMFDRNGKVKIMDFGLSKSPLVTTMTTLGTIMGTLGYVAPEQITNINLDKRVDIFSMGVILYQMVTNKLPFLGSNEIAVIHSIFNTEPVRPSEINPAVNNELEDIILKCLKKNPEDRFQSAEQLYVVLKKLI